MWQIDLNVTEFIIYYLIYNYLVVPVLGYV